MHDILEKLPLALALLLVCAGCAISTAKKEAMPGSPAPASLAPEETASAIPFAPTYSSAQADKYFDALEIYDSSPRASQGVYRHEGLIFIIVSIDTRKEKIEYPEGTAMLRTVALLRKHYPELPPKFNIRNRIVEKGFDEDERFYRYATAYREKDIERKLKK